MGGQQDKVGGQKNKVGGQKNKVGGQKNKVGGQKNKGGVKKTRWGVKKTRCPLACNQFSGISQRFKKKHIYIQESRNWSSSQVYLILWFQGCATASTSSSSQPLQARNVDSPWWLKRCWSLLFWAWYWVNYNDLTATSLESWLVREIIPKWP